MWRIFGLVFFENKDHFLTADKKSFCEQRIREFLTQKGIALTDSGQEVIRQQNNASDKFLEIIKTIDLRTVLHKLPGCKAIVTTGQKATDTLLSLIKTKPPQVGGYVEVVYENEPYGSIVCLPLPGLIRNLYRKKRSRTGICSRN